MARLSVLAMLLLIGLVSGSYAANAGESDPAGTDVIVEPMAMTVCTTTVPGVWSHLTCVCGAGRQVVIKYDVTNANGGVMFWGYSSSHMMTSRWGMDGWGINPIEAPSPGTYWNYTEYNGPAYARLTINAHSTTPAGTITFYCSDAFRMAGDGAPVPV